MSETPTPTPAPKPIPFHKRHKRALLIACALCVVIAILAWLFFKPEMLALKDWLVGMLVKLEDALQKAGPVPFFAAYAILPAICVPITFFHLSAPAFAQQVGGMGWVFVLAALCMLFNLAFSYWLAHYALRPLIEKIVRKLGYTLPVIPPGKQVATCILLRVTPGPPYILQSYILALAGVRFLPYMTISFLGQYGWGVAIILFGKAVLGGSVYMAFLAVALFIALVIATRLVRKYYTKKAALKNANTGTPGNNA